MGNVYNFVDEAEPLKKIESQKSVMTRLARQTTECGYFLCSYDKNKFFCMSAAELRINC
jgi:hypothetical protein